MERPAEVLDEDPLADLPAVAVHRERPAGQRRFQEGRDHLLPVLARPVGVRRPAHHDRQAVGGVVGERQQVGPGLARRIGVPGAERGLLVRPTRGERAVHLVGGDLQEPAAPPLRPVLPAGPPERLEEDSGAVQVGAREGFALGDGAVHMRLRGEVDHPVDALDERPHRFGVADVRVDETVARMPLGVRQVAARPGVGEPVHRDDPPSGFLPQEEVHEVAADEAGAAGHQADRFAAAHGIETAILPKCRPLARNSSAAGRSASG